MRPLSPSTSTAPETSASSTAPLSESITTSPSMLLTSTRSLSALTSTSRPRGHLDAVRHAAPHRTDHRARSVQLEGRVDDLVTKPGIAQSFGDLGLDADLVGVGADDRHRSGVVVDEQSGELCGRHGESLGALLVGDQLDDVERAPPERRRSAAASRTAPTAPRPRTGCGRSLAVEPGSIGGDRRSSVTVVMLNSSPIAAPPALGGGRLGPAADRAS